MSRRLSELADHVSARIVGDADVVIRSVAPLDSAGPDNLSFYADRRFEPALAQCHAGAIVLRADDVDKFSGNCLVVNEPYVAYAHLARLLHPAPKVVATRSASAIIAPDATVDDSACIHPGAVIESGAHIDPRVDVGPGAVIGRNVRIGADSRIGARAVVVGRAQVGERCLVGAGSIIGEAGFGFAPSEGAWIGIPQLGSVRVGDDVSIGAGTTIDRGTLSDTVIGNGVKLDNQIQIGHNVVIGDNSLIAASTAVAGSVHIGRGCVIAGRVAIRDHVHLADGVVIEAAGVVLKSIDTPGNYSAVVSVQPAARWRRNGALVTRLDELLTRIRRLERAGSEKKD